MNKKITISELSQLLSTNVSLINKKGWEDFLRIFFDQIKEGLQAEGNVKIKGLGTFKVVTVDARKSKDVNTGANTIIPAHNKISFTPDSSLAEILNKPYAHFEPTYVLAPEGEVDSPEIEEEDEAVVEEEKQSSEAIDNQTAIPASGIIAEETKVNPMQVAEETKVETEQVVEETKVETEQVVEETKVETEQVVEETKVETEQVVEETKVETEQVVEETKVVTEQVVEATKVETEQAAEETKVEPEQVVEEIKEEDELDESKENTEEEDTTEDEDENIETTPEETAAYASTFKRHDLPTEEEEEDKNSHSKKLGIAIILFLCILAVVALVAWMSDPNIVSKIRSKITGAEPVQTEMTVEPTNTTVIENKESEDSEDSEMSNTETDSEIEATNALVEKIENEAKEATEEAEEKPVVNKKDNKFTNFKEDFVSYMKKKHPEMDISDQGDPVEEKLGNASRLTLVSLRHYGAKDFWVYIYLYNKDVIKNPNNIKVGTKIKVPMLDNKRFVNPDSEHSILTAKEVQHAFVK